MALNMGGTRRKAGCMQDTEREARPLDFFPQDCEERTTWKQPLVTDAAEEACWGAAMKW